MGKPFSILHISDLHRSPRDPISNDELISALVSDRVQYRHETPSIAAPQAIIVSGDIIQGVPLGTENYSQELANQYAVAEAFLDELASRFIDGDRSRLIIVPGNHDVDWNTAFSALVPIDKNETPGNLDAAIHSESSPYRWDWKTQTLYRINDQVRYESRLDTFWTFFERFYSSVPNLLQVRSGADANLFSLCNDRIGVAAFNSCHGNDCFAFHGMIRPGVIARSHLDLIDSGRVFDLQMAVWHHSIEGAPYRTDYMDIDIVRGMIGRGFRVGLYGHQHKAQAVGHQVWLANQEKMAAVSAGSLCAGAKELPTGVYRQYSILEIASDFQMVRVHVRAMAVANLFSPATLPDFGGKSYIDLRWTRPRSVFGTVIDTDTLRRQNLIEQAEVAAKTGDRPHAITLLKKIPLSAGSYERALLLDAASQEHDWSTIVDFTDPPTTIDELVSRVNAFCRLNLPAFAIEALDRFSKTLNLPDAINTELRGRIMAQEKLKHE